MFSQKNRGGGEGLFDLCKDPRVWAGINRSDLFETFKYARPEFVQSGLGNGDLDPCLVLIVTPTQHIVDA